MTELQKLAQDLQANGFAVTVIRNYGVEVYLTNRKVSRMEVEIALDQLFDGIEFQLQSTTTGVLVR